MVATPLRVAVVQWPDGLDAGGDVWRAITETVTADRPDLLVTNELPFGPWLASDPTFDPGKAQRSIDEHRTGLDALIELGVPGVISSRPVWEGDRLANEAVAIQGGVVSGFHRKQYFPAETGWHEDQWFATTARDFEAVQIAGIRVGAMLCTEAMFNEHARGYGRDGAVLIAIPRATGRSAEQWHLAARMAALVSGCYVVSANRVGAGSDTGPEFGGEGFAYSPDGTLLGVTSRDAPMLVIEVDPRVVAYARKLYPRYVGERV